MTATVYFNQSRTTDKDDFTEFYCVFIGDLPGRLFVSGRLKRLFCLLVLNVVYKSFKEGLLFVSEYFYTVVLQTFT